MSLKPTHNEVNYMEVIRCHITYDGEQGLVAKTPNEQEYTQLLNNIKANQKLRPFTKSYKQFIYNDMYYCVAKSDNDVTVYSIRPIETKRLSDNSLAIFAQKKKMSILNFPSTTNYNYISTIEKTTFRLSNRVYLNFELHIDNEDDKSYHVYMNYNHDANVDWESAEQDVQKCCEFLC